MPINMSTKLSDLSPLTRRNVLLGIGAAASLPACETLDPVSYTHLTLPTILRV